MLTTPKPTMGTMLQESLRAPVTKIITPLCRGLLRIGISANMVTAIGAFATILTALLTFPNGRFFLGTLLIVLFILFDLLDGTLARLSEKGSSSWGALLDSTLDRLTDAIMLGAVFWYLSSTDDALAPIPLLAAIFGFLVSYVKARAQSLGIACDGGFAERTERIIILLLTTGFAGLGVPYVMTIGLWFLMAASAFTVLQRLAIVYKSAE